MLRIDARRAAEAREYLTLRLGDCADHGGTVREVRGYFDEDDRPVHVYQLACPRHGTLEEIEVSYGRGPESPDGHVSYGPGPEPSRLIDAGQWMLVSNRHATVANGAILQFQDVPPDPETAAGIVETVDWARAALVEVVRFLGRGDRLPDAAFWTEAGRRVRDDLPPEQLARAALEYGVAAYERLEDVLAGKWLGAAG